MKKNEDNNLVMEEIGIKSLEEITGGASLDIISKKIPILSGLVSRPIPIPKTTTGLVAPTSIKL